MRLQEIMSEDVATVPAEETAERAWERMRVQRIHHLVVTRDRVAVGILTDRDLGGSRGSKLRGGKTVAELMTPNVVSAMRTTTVRQAANMLRGSAIGCLPVFDKGKLIGIVTVSDLLELVGRGSERPAVKSERYTLWLRPGQRQKVGMRRTRGVW